MNFPEFQQTITRLVYDYTGSRRPHSCSVRVAINDSGEEVVYRVCIPCLGGYTLDQFGVFEASEPELIVVRVMEAFRHYKDDQDARTRLDSLIESVEVKDVETLKNLSGGTQ